MTHQHPHSSAVSRSRRIGLAQMSALARIGIVLPVIGLIWLVLWFLVQS
ncbi:hypothetical protein [Devosia sp. SL43]|nr:hypothetical protein [Devosia sp. SL43]UJW85197.1 hypothetical protein IM737_17615 [Devosia sp. SL43]